MYHNRLERSHKPRSGVALGGIGCGWFELRHDGTTANWNIANNAPTGYGPHFPLPAHSMLFFVVRIEEEGCPPKMRLLQIEESHGVAGLENHEYHYIHPWLQAMDRIETEASFPWIKMRFQEREMPLAIEMTAWSPFIPHNVKDSSLPLAFFDFEVFSESDRPIQVSLAMCARNPGAYDLKKKRYTSECFEGDDWKAATMGVTSCDETRPSYGNISIGSGSGCSTRWLGWAHPHPYYEAFMRQRTLPEIDDTRGRHKWDKETGELIEALPACNSTIAHHASLQHRGARFHHSFCYSWYFPNRYGRVFDDPNSTLAGYLEDENFGEEGEANKTKPKPPVRGPFEGHYYTNEFADSRAVLTYGADNYLRLYEETLHFHRNFFESTLPNYVLDTVNTQLNTFRTSSWLTKNGDFGIVEGLSPERMFAGLMTTDVAMYGAVPTAALFPELDQASLRAHLRLQQPNGVILHSIANNFHEAHPREASGKRVDMPGQYAVMALRAGLWADDPKLLEEFWPSVKRALDYVLRERDSNNDGLPDMEGIMCSYDNFPMFGAAPYVATQWLAALRIAVRVAGLLGDEESGNRYQTALDRGRETLETGCWNGNYYRLWNHTEKGHDEGILTDQILGEWALQLVGLEPVLDTERIKQSLRAVFEANYHPEQGLRNCSWPDDRYLHEVEEKCWVDQANTCWTGVEFAYASHAIYQGLLDEGEAVIRNIENRYRRYGMQWDHQEFGGHYFRPMSAWAIMNAYLGLGHAEGHWSFTPKMRRPSWKTLFATPNGYAHFRREGDSYSIEALRGCFAPKSIGLTTPKTPGAKRLVVDSRQVDGVVDGDGVRFQLPDGFELKESAILRIEPMT